MIPATPEDIVSRSSLRGETEGTNDVPDALRPLLVEDAAKAPVNWALVEGRLRFFEERLANRLDLVAVDKPRGPSSNTTPATHAFELKDAARTAAGLMRAGKRLPGSPDAPALTALLLGHLVGDLVRPVCLVTRWTDVKPDRVMWSHCGPGHYRVGFYERDPAGLALWLCLDFDGAGHKAALADALAAALDAHRRARELGITAYLERSRGGKGWHLWAFFAAPVATAKARRLGLALAPKNAPLQGGGTADAVSGTAIEVFPKSKDGEVGNQVWAPWFHGAAAGANAFYEVSGSGELGNEMTVFEPVLMTEDAVEQALATLPADAALAVPEGASPTSKMPRTTGASGSVKIESEEHALLNLHEGCPIIREWWDRQEGGASLSYEQWFRFVSVLARVGDAGVERLWELDRAAGYFDEKKFEKAISKSRAPASCARLGRLAGSEHATCGTSTNRCGFRDRGGVRASPIRHALVERVALRAVARPRAEVEREISTALKDYLS